MKFRNDFTAKELKLLRSSVVSYMEKLLNFLEPNTGIFSKDQEYNDFKTGRIKELKDTYKLFEYVASLLDKNECP